MTDDEICQRLADAIRYHVAEAQYRATLTWHVRWMAALTGWVNGTRSARVTVLRAATGTATKVDVGPLQVWVLDGENSLHVWHGKNKVVPYTSNPSFPNSDLAAAVRELANFYGVLPEPNAKRAAAIAAVQSLTR